MSEIDNYLKGIPNPQKIELQRVRKIINKNYKDAEEVLSYGMPAFKYEGKYLAGFNVHKNHFGFYPTSHPIEELKDNLTGFGISKGAIRYTLNNPLSEQLILALLNVRVTDISS